MTINLKFEEKDFTDFRSFVKSVEKQLGKVYVGTDSLCFYFDYPKELIEKLRPHSQNKQLEFELNSIKPDESKNGQKK